MLCVSSVQYHHILLINMFVYFIGLIHGFIYAATVPFLYCRVDKRLSYLTFYNLVLFVIQGFFSFYEYMVLSAYNMA